MTDNELFEKARKHLYELILLGDKLSNTDVYDHSFKIIGCHRKVNKFLKIEGYDTNQIKWAKYNYLKRISIYNEKASAEGFKPLNTIQYK